MVSTLAVLFGFAGEVSENGDEIWAQIPAYFTRWRLQLHDLQPAVRPLLRGHGRHQAGDEQLEMDPGRHWYMCGLAYVVSFIVYQIGSLFVGGGFGIGTVIAILAVIAIIYLLVRKNPYDEEHLAPSAPCGLPETKVRGRTGQVAAGDPAGQVANGGA